MNFQKENVHSLLILTLERNVYLQKERPVMGALAVFNDSRWAECIVQDIQYICVAKEQMVNLRETLFCSRA